MGTILGRIARVRGRHANSARRMLAGDGAQAVRNRSTVQPFAPQAAPPSASGGAARPGGFRLPTFSPGLCCWLRAPPDRRSTGPPRERNMTAISPFSRLSCRHASCRHIERADGSGSPGGPIACQPGSRCLAARRMARSARQRTSPFRRRGRPRRNTLLRAATHAKSRRLVPALRRCPRRPGGRARFNRFRFGVELSARPPAPRRNSEMQYTRGIHAPAALFLVDTGELFRQHGKSAPRPGAQREGSSAWNIRDFSHAGGRSRCRK